ncbi:SsrA-binding protein SmpB [Chloroflexota bacterium]
MNFKTISLNRKARHDYHIEGSVEAGLVLTGTEIKSVRAGSVNLRDAYARPENGELWLVNAHISHYPGGNRYNHDPMRWRKLLLHRDQILEMTAAVTRKGLTLVPLKLYLKNGIAKVELGFARGKKLYDKRESLARRDVQRQIDRAIATGKKRRK